MQVMQGAPVILVAAGVALINREGNILLLKGHDGVWDLPGGHMEVGESLEETAACELLEETGLTVSALDLLGIASGRRVFHEERNAYYVTAVYQAKAYSEDLKLSHEHIDGKFFPSMRSPIFYPCPFSMSLPS